MKKFIINAKYKRNILVPYGAITDNVDFMTCSRVEDVYIQTRDGIVAKMRAHKEVNLISDEGRKLLEQILPDMHPYNYLMSWYQRLYGRLHSLDFQYIELDDPDKIVSIPAKAD